VAVVRVEIDGTNSRSGVLEPRRGEKDMMTDAEAETVVVDSGRAQRLGAVKRKWFGFSIGRSRIEE
jgi:hypothetical protein